ncbi:restriction endonuclease subunit S [Vibrio metschnikovii]|nr:restriction endonuclease subunit S [Vibrio metschnikovii]
MAVENLITEHIDIWTSAEKTRSTSGRGSSKKLELYGVKKLRELILELAVRGKLVPQNPNDEPASVLLERIAAEKAQLVKEKKIKKQTALPEVTEQEAPFNVPKGWEWTRLGNLSSDIHYGYTASAKPNSEGVRLLRITDIQNDKVNWETVPACDITEEKAKSYLLENDDILIARTGGTIGKSYLVENIDLQAVFASYLIRVKRVQAVYAPFTKVFLGSQLYWKQLIENSAGTGQPNVNATALKQLLFIVPPFNQQKRIVAKVDELMTLCDQLEQQTEASIEAHQVLVTNLLNTLTNSADADELMQNWARISEHFDTLFTTEESIDQLKQTILQLAVMGKLVPQNPDDEPAAELLKRIAEDGDSPKKVRLTKPISEPEEPLTLPTGWVFTRLESIIQISSGKNLTAKKMDSNGTIPVYGGNGVTGYHSENNVSEPTIVIGRVGFYCGSVHLTPKKAWVTDNAFVTKFSHSNLNLEFLFWLLKATNLNENDSATAQPVISGRKVYPIVVGLPPLNEQARIVAKLNELMAMCDFLKQSFSEHTSTQLLLTNTIVEHAV